MRTLAIGWLGCAAAITGCTLLNSQNGLVGPPLDDAGADAGVGGGGEVDGSHPSTQPDGSTSDTDSGASETGPVNVTSDGSVTTHDSGPGTVDSSPPPPPPGDGGPLTIYSGRVSPLGIGVHAGTICWVEGQNLRTIYCGPTTGGGNLVTAASQTNDPFADSAFDVALDDTYYYWSNGPKNQVVRKAINGGSSEQYFTGDNYVSYIAIDSTDGSKIWASDYQAGSGGGNVVVGPSPSNASQSTLVFPSEPEAAGVGTYQGSTYWGVPSSVSFAQSQGNVAITRVASAGAVTGLALDSAGTVYFLSGNQQIYKIPLGASTPTLVYDWGTSFGDSDLAVDDDAIYWSERDLGQIIRLPK